MIIVTGATGQLGGLIVESLLARGTPAEEIGVSVRNPKKAQGFADRGVRVRQGDFTDPAGLVHAFENATQVLIVSVDAFGDDGVRRHRVAIDAARKAGARRILYTSHMGASVTSHFQACRDHAATEEALQASGVPFTSLRNGFYSASALQFLGQAWESGSLVLPADGPVSWTAHADLADAVAEILADEGRFDGPTPPLTAQEALTCDDIVRIAAGVTGRELNRIVVSDEQMRAQLSGVGLPAQQVDGLLGIFAAARDGEFATVDPTLTTLIGRAPLTLEQQLRQWQTTRG